MRIRIAKLMLLCLIPIVWGAGTALPVDSQGEWTQWRGNHRDGHAAPQKLLKTWPEGGPALAWKFDGAGIGYSSLAILSGRLYTMGKIDQANWLLCLDSKTGQQLWKTEVGPSASSESYNTGWGDGPRGTPTIDGDFVYGITDIGRVFCINKDSGRRIWIKDMVTELGGSIPEWGYSESPLIDQDRVVITPGGQHLIAGLDTQTGETIWKAKVAGKAQYVSALRHEFSGMPVYITANDSGLLGIDCDSGELLFSHAATGNTTAVIPTPVVHGDRIYHSSAYKAGNALVQITLSDGKLAAKPVYQFAKESMESHHGGVVLEQGTIFGFSKALRGCWMAQDFATGRVLWTKRLGKSTSGSIACADGMLYCYEDQEGICYLVSASPDGWQLRGQLKIPEETSVDRRRGAIWAHPVIAEQKLLIRDQDKIFAFDIAER